jgi:hypothetical protein
MRGRFTSWPASTRRNSCIFNRRIQRHLRILLVPSAYYSYIGGIEELTKAARLASKARGHEAGVLTNRWPAGVQGREVLDDIGVEAPEPKAHLHRPSPEPAS